jgi:hypothetical protein
MISEYVEANSGLHFNSKTATVSRVDFAKDFYLSEAKVFQVIKRLSDKILPRMDKLNNSQTKIAVSNFLRITAICCAVMSASQLEISSFPN